MAFKMAGFSPFTQNNKNKAKENQMKQPKLPSSDPDWLKREINRHIALGLNYDHLKKYAKNKS
jgi:hypothetical protein|tara:strand:- start:348 stop:536 length:189 start_codon:yes stop_codon:yes gene_type:complete